ncbi:MAG TPA: amidohydrolase family protein [Ktedonobacteraceae bacterium]
MPLQEQAKTTRIITVEEHYATPAFMEGPGRSLKKRAQGPETRMRGVPELLCDLDERRITNMDTAGIDVQVLSLTAPGTEQLDAAEAITRAREINDFLARAVSRHPDRLAGFATLPTPVPEVAAAELERTVQTYGFKGALINGHVRGRYLDDPFFWPILERAEALHVPLYLHPTQPPQAVVAASYTGNFAPEIASALANSSWGWHIETAIHVLRIVLSGAFDRYPGLQLIIGHLGEGLPFMMPRLELTLPQQLTNLERPIGAYLRENLHYTFSGFNFLPPFLDLFFEVGVNRILFSADYPYASMTQARSFLDQLPVSPADREQIAHGNAERLLKL